MLTLLVVLAVLAILFGAAVVATQDSPLLADAPPDDPDLDLPPGRLVAEDVRRVRFGMVFRGYRMREVDAVLERLAAELAVRDSRLAELEQALVEVVEPAVQEAEARLAQEPPSMSPTSSPTEAPRGAPGELPAEAPEPVAVVEEEPPPALAPAPAPVEAVEEPPPAAPPGPERVDLATSFRLPTHVPVPDPVDEEPELWEPTPAPPSEGPGAPPHPAADRAVEAHAERDPVDEEPERWDTPPAEAVESPEEVRPVAGHPGEHLDRGLDEGLDFPEVQPAEPAARDDRQA